MEMLKNIPLAPLTTLGVGGTGKYFVRVSSEDDLKEAFYWAESAGEKVFVLGGGSNILVSDSGFDGVVIKMEIAGVQLGSEDSSVTVTAGAGEDWDRFVESCVSKGLAGIECLSGIPGTVGGTPIQNVGAYGQEVSETIVSVRCFDRKERKLVELSNKDCGFEYRKSILNTTNLDRYVVLSVVYRLTRGGEPKIVYKDLVERLGRVRPTLEGAREAVLSIRRSKSMVIDTGDPNSRSAGSFFKNPIIESSLADQILKGVDSDWVPRFVAADQKVKIPAAWLIERAGFQKGYVLGNAGISRNHSLALINRGNASASDIVALKNLIQKTVFDKFGIELQPEPIFVGF